MDPLETVFERVQASVVTLQVTTGMESGVGSGAVISGDGKIMTAAHVGHNAKVGSNCILTNGSGLGGHAELADRVILSSHVMIHQFCRVGESAMVGAMAGMKMDMKGMKMNMLPKVALDE